MVETRPIHSATNSCQQIRAVRAWPPLLRVAGIAAVLLTSGRTAPAQTIALVGGTVNDGTGKPGIPNAVVLVTGDRLACVGTVAQCQVPPNATRVNVAGRFIAPGLVDAHVHLSRTGWLDGRPDLIDAPEQYPYPGTARALRADPARWYRSYLCSGVTAVYDVGGHPWTNVRFQPVGSRW